MLDLLLSFLVNFQQTKQKTALVSFKMSLEANHLTKFLPAKHSQNNHTFSYQFASLHTPNQLINQKINQKKGKGAKNNKIGSTSAAINDMETEGEKQP